MMVFDIITLVKILGARNPFAARQFLGELTHRTPDNTGIEAKNPVFEYQKMVILKACRLEACLQHAKNRQAPEKRDLENKNWLQTLY